MPAEHAARAIRDLYADDLERTGGVVHVAAVWQAPDGGRFNMHIVDETPASSTDTFVLRLARARADAIVTTGKILREEPTLDFGLGSGLDLHSGSGSGRDPRQAGRPCASRGSDPDSDGLAAWRRERLGRSSAPLIVVLTRGTGLDLDHPALVPGRTLLMTGRRAAEALAPGCAARGIEVAGRASPGLLDTLGVLRDERGCGTPVVEAGPSTSSALYAAPGHVDELLLSLCHTPVLPAGVAGDAFPGREVLEAAGLAEVSRSERDEASGRWTFTRHVRTA